MTKKNRRVFLDVSIDGSPVEKMVFELFYDVAPKTAENFRALCTGEKGISPRVGRPLHYKGCFFHKIVKGSMAQGGDFYKRDGSYGESIYDEKFPDESSSKLKHDERGLLSMSIADRDARGSLFAITFRALDYLDRKNIVFGKVVKGDEVLEKIENAGDDDNGAPAVTVKIINCGDYSEDKKRTRSSRVSNHKKSSRGRRKKKRRYYSSESETSTDSETDSSDYESDSESDTLSSSDFSSSSDDRRKKRKRSSKKDKYKRNKRRDKRRQRKRRSYKREKHTSKRSSICSASEDNGGAANDGKGGTESRSPGQKVASVANQNTEINGREKGKFPRENGQRRPDGETTKSRNHSISPKSDTSRSMSISPRRALSPNVDKIKPKCKSISRSPSQSGRVGPMRKSPTLPPLPSRRSLSPSPVRSAHKNISRSPIRFSLKNVNKSLVRGVSKAISRSPVGNAHRSISKSLVRPPQRSVSKSPVRSFRKSMSISRSPIRGQRSSRSPVKSYARRYRSPTPDCSPVRSYRYARSARDRYGRRSPSRRYRSPPKHRSPLRYRSRRSRARSPVRSYSPVAASRLRNSPFVERQRSLSHSSVSRSSLDSPPPKRETRSKSISFSSSGTPPGNKGTPGSGEG